MNRTSVRAVVASLVVSMTAVFSGGPLSTSPAGATPPGSVTINLVVTNDFHGQIDDNLLQWAGTVLQLLGEAPEANTLFLGAGDNVGESAPASAAQQDNPTIDILNLLGLDATATGNHEFDRGYDDLVNRIAVRADFPILGANVTKADGSPALPASATFTVGGIRLAVIGVVTDTTPDLTPTTGIVGINFGDPITAINAEVDRLNSLPESEKPQVIVAAIHDGASWGTWSLDQTDGDGNGLFARLINDTSPDVAAIISGHTHNTYLYDAPIPDGSGRLRPVIETGYHGMNVGQITLTVNPQNGEVTAYTARNVVRVSTSDTDLMATYPVLTQIAQIRDEAKEFAAAKTAAAQVAQTDYDAAVAVANDAHTAAEGAKTNYEAAVAAMHDAYAAANDARGEYEAAVVARQEAHAVALEAKGNYEAEVANGRTAFTRAADLRVQYNEAVASGREASNTAADIRDRYQVAVSDGKASSARAADLRAQYNEAVASGRDAFNTAADIKTQYNNALADGVPTWSPEMITLAGQYQEAVATANTSYATAQALIPEYNTAIASGNTAYATAASLKPAYDAAMEALTAATATVAQLKQPYDAAMDVLNAAIATTAGLKDAFQDAVATLNTSLENVNVARTTLLSLL